MIRTATTVHEMLSAACSRMVLNSSSLSGTIGRGSHDLVGRGAAGLERRIVEHRRDLDEPVQLARLGRLAARQHAPGEARRLPRQDGVDRIGCQGHRAHHRVELDLLALHAEQPERQRIEAAAQARIDAQRLEQRVGPAEAVGEAPDLVGRQEQESVAAEEFSALRLLNRADQALVRRQRGHQLVGGLLGELRRRRIDDGEDLLLRELLLKRERALRPGQGFREHVLDVGLDCEISLRVDAGSESQRQRDEDDPIGMPTACIDDTDNG
jgi:hypothetical protein